MTGISESEVRLGVVVFGRLMGFPWWPAVVSASPENGNWAKGGKFWVVFFNDSNGAWLKSSELRSFDPYNKSLCLEQNGSVLKYRRYKDRVNKAIHLADKYTSNPREKRGSKRLPPRPEEQEVISVSLEEESDASHEESKTRRKRLSSGKRSGYRKHRGRSHLVNENEEHDEEDFGDDAVAAQDAGRGKDGRSRRKRIKSSRYDEFMQPKAGRGTEKRKGLRLIVPLDGPLSDDEKRRDQAEKDVAKSALVVSRGVQPGKHRGWKRRRRSESNATFANGSDLYNSRSNKMRRVTGELADVESLADTDSADGKNASSIEVKPPPSRRLANEPIHRPRPVVFKDSAASRTRQMYISELTSLASPKPQVLHGEGSKVPSLRRSVRSRAGSSEYDDSSQTGEGTDSEAEPERERKITSGSLQAAAEDLVECAVRDSLEGDSIVDQGDVLGMHSVALGGNEILSSILNRISSLERNVLLLQSSAKKEEVATLGEDVTAAGVKSAVEALVSASAAFAKARDYDSGAICRSLQLLWSDGHFPLSGSDGEILRTMATSLVLAPCKRRREQLSRERHKPHQQKSTGKEHPNLTPIRQKSDVRDRTRKPLEDVGRREGNGQSSALDPAAGSKFHPESSEASLSDRETKVAYTVNKRSRGEAAKECDDAGPMIVKRITSHREQNETAGDNACRIELKETSPRKRKISYEPRTNRDGVIVVEEEVLGEGAGVSTMKNAR